MYFYGVDGALLTTGGIDDDWDYNVYFAGRQVWREKTGFSSQMPAMAVSPDRLGSTVEHFPFGDEPTATAPNREKFATYYRDQITALDYARNRYYSSTIARFTTADPYQASGGPADPQSWNRYAYVEGDPVNYNDTRGLQRCGAYYWVGPPDDRTYYPLDPCGGGEGGGIFGSAELLPDLVGPESGPVPVTVRKRTPECDSLLPTSSTDDFSGRLTDIVVANILSVSANNATLASLVAVTWWAESRFTMYPTNNGVAFGPMQLVPGSWDALMGAAGVTADAVFGQPATRTKGAVFAGSAEANLSFGAYVLNDLLGRYGAADAAGYFRAGEGNWGRTDAGRSAFEGRKKLYTSWTNGTNGRLKEFFEKCVDW